MRTAIKEFSAANHSPSTEYDFVIAAKVLDPEWKKTWDEEALYAKQVSGNRFRVCCIPGVLYDINFGDEVETDADYVITKIVRASGYYGYRFVCIEKDSTNTQTEADVLSALSHIESLVSEKIGKTIYGIAVLGEDAAEEVVQILNSYENAEKIQWEAIRRGEARK